jgi:hypothetical protein
MTLLLGRRLINIGSHWHLMILWPCCFFHENVINTLFRDEKKVSQLSLWVVMLSSWKGTYCLPSSHLSFQWRDALQFTRFLHVCVWWLVCVCVLTREKHFTSIFTSMFKGVQVLTNCSSASEAQRTVVAPSFVGEILVILVITQNGLKNEEDMRLQLERFRELFFSRFLKQTITHLSSCDLCVLLHYFWCSKNINNPSVCTFSDTKIAQFG